MLLHNGKSRFAQLVRQRVFVDLLEESTAKTITYGKGAPEDSLRYLIEVFPICSRVKNLHLCSSVFICGYPFMFCYF